MGEAVRHLNCSVLVVGAGGAGLRSAISASDVLGEPERVLVVTKGKLGRSGATALACSDRMAFHATLPHTEPGGPDSWKYHAEDIYFGGGEVSDADLAEILAKGSAEAFHYLESIGVPFVRRPDGLPDQFVTDGSKYARACYTGPYTANHIEEALVREVGRLGIPVREHTAVVRLLKAEGHIAGALCVDEATGDLIVVRAGAVVLATGGGGEIFKVNAYPPGTTGSGYGLAYRAGAELVNMEFLQIGLCSVGTKLACSGSFFRALPRLVNGRGEEFLYRYLRPDEVVDLLFRKGASWPAMYEEPTSRIDVAVQREVDGGNKVFLDFSRNPEALDWSRVDPEIVGWYRSKGVDLSDRRFSRNPLARLLAINPQSVEWLRERGVDLARGDLLEIAPAVQHFQGGVKIRPDGGTSVPGLYAAGEVAGGQHGAKRPGGNSLLDCQVFGRIAGESAARWAGAHRPNLEEALTELEELKEGTPASEVRRELGEVMSACAGVVRTERGLREGLKNILRLKEMGVKVDEEGPAFAAETSLMLDVGEMILRAAAVRRESRGCHLSFDDSGDPLPRDDGNWRRYIVIFEEDGRMTLEVREPIRPRWTT
ncbi:MAG: succinate dehydrogenase [Candidatus Latescibacterota bacterium]|nr:MAG: succinate dehydrogenase [Candidatus Latescibacterota bacterium]RKY74443.1 MAG: succinate dehydrogenase [Candidatus Latescibacterota bacterium]